MSKLVNERKHLLIISPDDVGTGRDGLAVYTRQMISALYEHADVSLVVLGAKPDVDAGGPFSAIYLDARRSQLQARIKSLVSRSPAYVLEFDSTRILDAIEAIVSSNAVDKIVLNHRRAAWLAPRIARSKNANLNRYPLVYVSHNAEERSLSSLAGMYAGPTMRRLALRESRKTGSMERQVVACCKTVTCISEDDAVTMNLNEMEADVHIIPASMSVKSDLSERPVNQPTIVLVGSMTWAPKRMNALWLVNSIFPRVRARIPDVRLIVAGSGASSLCEGVTEMDSIEFYEAPESLEPFFRRADVFVVPERQEGGLKIKTVEASAYGLPIVSTAAGAAGSRLEHGVSVMIADDEAEFANRIVGLLSDRNAAAELGNRAREVVREYFDPEITARGWRQALLSK